MTFSHCIHIYIYVFYLTTTFRLVCILQIDATLNYESNDIWKAVYNAIVSRWCDIIFEINREWGKQYYVNECIISLQSNDSEALCVMQYTRKISRRVLLVIRTIRERERENLISTRSHSGVMGFPYALRWKRHKKGKRNGVSCSHSRTGRSVWPPVAKEFLSHFELLHLTGFSPPRSLRRVTWGRVPVSLRRETGNGRIRRKLVGDRPCIEL